MSVSNAWLLNKFKRRALLMVSSIGMAICMTFSGLATYMIKNGKTLSLTLQIPFKTFCDRTRHTLLDTCDIFIIVCLHVDDWSFDDTVDHDS